MSSQRVNAPFKRPRLANSNDITSKIQKTSVIKGKPLENRKICNSVSVSREAQKLESTTKSNLDSNETIRAPIVSDKFYVVLWRKISQRKNKTWDGDGFGMLKAGDLTVKIDVKGGSAYKTVGKGYKKSLEGIFNVGGYEMEIDYEISNAKELERVISLFGGKGNVEVCVAVTQDESLPVVASNPQFKQVAKREIVTSKTTRTSLYDPSVEGALVMTRPSKTDVSAVDVVVDPSLSTHLRPHQREGVKFLYECVMGLRGGNGALLADEMGLGKTLMTITLIWTLLRQTPSANNSIPIVKRVLIACPVTLVGNWKKEFKKWLNMNRIGVLAIDGKQKPAMEKAAIRSFGKTRVYQVLIVGYEKLLTCKEDLGDAQFDLLICDEGHRLKNSQNKVLKFLKDLNIKRRVLLTGTPIQNDLGEFYNIIDFINPTLFGSFASFQREFMRPILRSREVNCINKDVIKMGNDKSNELIELTKGIVLRRTSSIISNYLPPRTDMIIFCRPTTLQTSLFELVTKTKTFNRVLQTNVASDSLSLITLFKKICNSPSLITSDKLFNSLKGDFTTDLTKKRLSGKLSILIPLLLEIQKQGEKIVVISNYTQTLDLLQEIIQSLNMTFSRLDGSTPNKQRDTLVTAFNKSSQESNFIFLLSAKSGGVGLNLIGASRLVLFDNDWNPSIDLQAMARIHRDGQKRPVFIYRLLTTGCIDEKIFQRQLMKNNLSDKFLDNKTESKDDVFDMNDLKDLFTLNLETKSNTHDLIDCECDGSGEVIDSPESSDDEDEKEQSSEEVSSETNNGWISALDYKQMSQEEVKKKSTITSSLTGYRHFDPLKLLDSQQVDFEDSVVEKIVQTFSEDNKAIPISFMLTKLHKKAFE